MVSTEPGEHSRCNLPNEMRRGSAQTPQNGASSMARLATVVFFIAVFTTPSVWASQPSFMGLGDLPGGIFDSIANDISSDGSVVVGYGDSPNGSQAIRWTQATGITSLGNIHGQGYSTVAYGVSGNGAVTVGSESNTSNSSRVAFRWTQSGGMVGLGGSNEGLVPQIALGVSWDGSVVVGSGGTMTAGTEAFRWTEAT